MPNLVAFFIMLTTAATLHASGHTDIQSTEQAAEALKPVAGMIVGSSRKQMGKFVATKAQKLCGWFATGMMAVAAVAMFITM